MPRLGADGVNLRSVCGARGGWGSEGGEEGGEGADEGDVGGEPAQLGKIARGEPAEGEVLELLRIGFGGDMADVAVHRQMEVGIVVFYRIEQSVDCDPDGKFLSDLSGEGLRGCLSGLNLPAGKFPISFPFPVASLCSQDFAVSDDDGCHDFNLLHLSFMLTDSFKLIAIRLLRSAFPICKFTHFCDSFQSFFAIAFNIKKMCSKIAKQAKNGGNKPHSGPFLLILRILPSENRIFWQNRQKSVAKKISKPQSAKKRVHRKKSNYDTLSNLFNPDGRWACHHKHTLVTFEPYLRI